MNLCKNQKFFFTQLKRSTIDFPSKNCLNIKDMSDRILRLPVISGEKVPCIFLTGHGDKVYWELRGIGICCMAGKGNWAW